MKKIETMIMLLFVGLFSAGCSGAFWGGTASGVAATGAGYELRARQQMERIERDLKNGSIDQREFDIRKDQIQRGSVAY